MLSVIIINYNSVRLILECISSIYKNTYGLLFEIIIVDNDGNVENADRNIVLNTFPNVIWESMGYNAGFARANNRGIKIANGDVVLLLNPDTLIQDNVLSNTYHKLVASPFVACGVQLLNEDGSPQISGNYAMKGGLNYLLPLPFLGGFVKKIGELVRIKQPSDKNIIEDKVVDWINGAFLMVKKTVVNQSGLLDEDFFLYAEEAEWCSRLKKQGDLVIFGTEHIIHLQGETANKSFNSEGKGYYNLFDKKGAQIIVSNFVRIRKEFGVFWFLIMLFFYTIEIPIFLIGGIFTSFLGKTSWSSFCTMWVGFCRNIVLLYSLNLKIIRNNPYFYKVI